MSPPPMYTQTSCDVLIVGGGLGGCAAALAAADLGKRVILTEEYDWLGGQATSQAVPPDEHQWIERFGCTRRYRQFRQGIRQYYRDYFPLTPRARANRQLNPGGGRVSRISHLPRVSLAVLEQMLAYPRAKGLIRVLTRHRPIDADTAGDRIRAVTLEQLDTNDRLTVEAPYILDATELGDLLPLANVEYVSGTESCQETGEPHAPNGESRPENVQAITWCLALGFDPTVSDGDDRYRSDPPACYASWRRYIPEVTPAWCGSLLAWSYCNPVTLKPTRRTLFPHEAPDEMWRGLWHYRQIVEPSHFTDPDVHAVTILNWPQNDYLGGNLIDCSATNRQRYEQEARDLSLSLFHWLQNDAPRPDGGQGYPGLYLVPDVLGTSNGLAMAPYIRESRRIRARFTVTENHIGKDALGGQRPAPFPDSVGIGYYRIDLHPSCGGDNYIDIAAQPFQIPLGSLLPQRVTNLLAACKNIGTTHISNGCYRLHPVEWNIGEAAGLLAGFCLSRAVSPTNLYDDAGLLADFQSLLTKQGIELTWPDEVFST